MYEHGETATVRHDVTEEGDKVLPGHPDLRADNTVNNNNNNILK